MLSESGVTAVAKSRGPGGPRPERPEPRVDHPWGRMQRRHRAKGVAPPIP